MFVNRLGVHQGGEIYFESAIESPTNSNRTGGFFIILSRIAMTLCDAMKLVVQHDVFSPPPPLP